MDKVMQLIFLQGIETLMCMKHALNYTWVGLRISPKAIRMSAEYIIRISTKEWGTQQEYPTNMLLSMIILQGVTTPLKTYK
jgi:hypothetical protein